MMKKTAVVIVHGHAPKWLQVMVSTLQRHTNERQFDIFIACTWPEHPSIKAVTETSLGDNVIIHECKTRLHSHATGLDEVLDLIRDNDDYDYMWCGETDAAVLRDGWLDWFHDQIGDAGMAGFFWHEGTNHYNINPSGTLYRKDMLVKFQDECRGNASPMFWHPKGNRHDSEEGMDPSIKDVVGCFAETRGIESPNGDQLCQIMQGVPQASWFEPGSWVYYRSLDGYEHVRVSCDHIYTQFGPVNSPEGTYYGGKEDPYYVHFWGGTRAYDFLKHPINDQFVSGGAPYWLQREDNIWKAMVLEDVKAVMEPLYLEMKFEESIRANLPSVDVAERLGLV